MINSHYHFIAFPFNSENGYIGNLANFVFRSGTVIAGIDIAILDIADFGALTEDLKRHHLSYNYQLGFFLQPLASNALLS